MYDALQNIMMLFFSDDIVLFTLIYIKEDNMTT